MMTWEHSHTENARSPRLPAPSVIVQHGAGVSRPEHERGGLLPARRPRDMALVCVLALFALVASDCQRGSAARSGRIDPLAVSVSHIPDPGLRTDESIDAFDFVTDESGSLHFVWSARRSDSGKPWNKRTEVWYQRGDQGGTRWTANRDRGG